MRTVSSRGDLHIGAKPPRSARGTLWNPPSGTIMEASERVEVADYDQAWPDAFENERQRVLSAV